MDLVQKLKLLDRNKKQRKIKDRKDELENKYLRLKQIYDKVEKSLKCGNINISVCDYWEKELTLKYFSNYWESYNDIFRVTYTFELTEKGIEKLENDFQKAKKDFINFDDEGGSKDE